jgi:KDO2-lipid IV(A) lauroyltransferase
VSNAWQYYVLKGISRLVCLLPYTWVASLGRKVGRLYYSIAVRQRQRAILQLSESLQADLPAAKQIVRRLFANLGQTLLEVMYTPRLTPENIKEYVRMENRRYLAEALAEGHGVVFLTAHVGNWEWLGAALAMDGFPMTSIIKRQPNDQHTRLLNEYRELAGIEVFARRSTEIVGAAKALKQGKILGFLADQDAGVEGIFVEFLGRRASTPLGPAVFAKRFHSPVVPVFILHCPQGGHRIVMHPPLRYRDTGNAEADLYRLTEEMTKVTENVIRSHPEEWLWFQKRWNTKERTGDPA